MTHVATDSRRRQAFPAALCAVLLSCVVPEVPFGGKLCGVEEVCPAPFECLYVPDQSPGICVERGVTQAPPAPAVEVSDDFDAAGTESPWTVVTTAAGQRIEVVPEAAHAGGLGLLHEDSSAEPGPGPGLAVGRSFMSPTDALSLRAWIRIRPTVAEGEISVVRITSGVEEDATLAMASVSFPGGALSLSGFDSRGSRSDEQSTASLSPDTWNLLEVIVSGAGTLNGSRSLWLNGERVALRSALNWTDRPVTAVSFGQPWFKSGGFQGVTHFDDVRVSSAALPDRLAVEVPQTLQANQCAPMAITLRAATGLLARTADALQITLSADGDATHFYLEAACEQETTLAEVPAGFAGATVFWRPRTEGTLQLRAAHPDLLPGSRDVTVGAPEAATGCVTVPGASSTAGSAAAVAVAARILVARRRRR